MYSIIRIASLMALIGYAQADFAVGTSASQSMHASPLLLPLLILTST